MKKSNFYQKTFQSLFKWQNILFFIILGFLIFKQYPVWENSYKQQGRVIEAPYYFEKLNGMLISPKKQKRVYMFWATWCGPCHVQMELVDQAIKSGLAKKEGFYAISIDENINEVRAFSRKKSFSFPLYMDSQKKARNFFSVKATPSILFINENNEIINYYSGISPIAILKIKSFL